MIDSKFSIDIISVIPAWPESFFTILNKSEGFPTSGNDNENKYSIYGRPVVSAAGLFIAFGG
jgi:hypothetical protein